jgi:predicted PurR-regulated permease PerM
MTNPNRLFLGGAFLLILAALLWTALPVLSPIWLGGILIFILLGLKDEGPVLRRLAISVVLTTVLWIFIDVKGTVIPFLIAYVLAYLLDPLADRMERIGIRRGIGVFVFFVLTFGLLGWLGSIFIPSLAVQIQELIKHFPTLVDQVLKILEHNLSRILVLFKLDPVAVELKLTEQATAQTQQFLLHLLSHISGIGSFLTELVHIVIVPFLTFYFLRDFNNIQKWSSEFVPKPHRSNYFFFLWRMNRILGAYFRSQILVCLIMGFLTWLGFTIFGLQFALLIGITSALLNIIPFFGLIANLSFALLTALITPDPMVTMFKIGIVFLFVHALEAYVISPKIVGDRLGLHPVAVIFSVFVFSHFLGFWGLIVGVPIAAFIKFLMDEWKRRQNWRQKLAEKHAGCG